MIPVANPIIGDDERAAVDRVLRSGMLAQGAEQGLGRAQEDAGVPEGAA